MWHNLVSALEFLARQSITGNQRQNLGNRFLSDDAHAYLNRAFTKV